jgi:hypothetical protein
MPLALVNEATVEEITEALGYVTETMRAVGSKDQRLALLKIVDDLLDAKLKASCASR